MRSDYEVVIGLEVHAELATKTKMYCSCKNEFSFDPNINCCPICLGMPGTMPKVNEKVIEYAVKMGLATNCKIARFSKQDRKNYYYPDLPKAYQTSQFDLPLCYEGYLDVNVDEDTVKRIGITRIHIEEDAGKLIHDEYTGNTLVDMNRAGVPLIEIVSEPDMRSSKEAVAYVETLKGILEYLGICDCKMQEGSLRCDVNLSVRKKGETKFGTRTETKNLNSFRSIGRHIDTEIERQIDIIENGGKILQETRRYDDSKGMSFAMRTKEEASDYRYFEEPDLSSIVLSEEYITNIKNSLPILPNERKDIYMNKYNLSKYDAMQITSSKEIADYFDNVNSICNNPKMAVNWIMGDFSRLLNENYIAINESKVKEKDLADLIILIDKKVISSAIAKTVFEEMFNTGKSAKEIVDAKGLSQITDENAILDIVKDVISNNMQSVTDYFNGRDRALGFLVGNVMKLSKGKANPSIVNKLILEELNKYKGEN